MAEGRAEFEHQLRELGYEPDPGQPGNRTAFPYWVPGGRFEGQDIALGFEVPPDFPRTPPPGPHVRPQLLPVSTSNPLHPYKVDASNFGPEWEYWSRPYRQWKGRESVRTYLVHIENLFR